MDFEQTTIKEVLSIHPKVIGDERGYFLETYRKNSYSEMGIVYDFVQENQSLSRKGVLRGIHYQIQQAQGKLVWVTQGRVYDVAVDLRRPSPTFGQWVAKELSEDNHTQLWIPPGSGHAFLVLSETASFQYKTTSYYAPQFERTIDWNDPVINIRWPQMDVPYIISEKDRLGKSFSTSDVYEAID